MDKTMSAWRGKTLESSCYTTDEMKAFSRDMKRYIVSQLPSGAELVGYTRGHFFVSGFIKRGEKYVYFSVSDVRGHGWENTILVRTAKGDRDFSGGANCFANLDNLGSRVDNLLNQQFITRAGRLDHSPRQYHHMEKTINSNGTCSECRTKSIHYSILDGVYTYFCTRCDKSLTSKEVLTDRELEPTQEQLAQFVKVNIGTCQSSLVEMLYEKGIVSMEDCENYCKDNTEEIDELQAEIDELEEDTSDDGLMSDENIVKCKELEERMQTLQEEMEEPQDVLEWWTVDSWMARKLREQGEVILDTDWECWWGRTTSGMAISMDSVIEAIYKSIQ